jgi:hypothetical protein
MVTEVRSATDDCIVLGCENMPMAGKFDGLLCKPCHDSILDFLKETKNSNSNFILELRTNAKAYLQTSEAYKLSRVISEM